MALGAWGSMHQGDQVKPERENNRPEFTQSYNHHVVWYENDGVHKKRYGCGGKRILQTGAGSLVRKQW